MTSELKVTQTVGGNRHPMSVSGFIIAHLTMVGEDYISSMHRAYKRALDQLAVENDRKYAYHKPVYHSFEMQVQKLRREGTVEFSGREEVSDSPQFAGWDSPPTRHYYRLVSSPVEIPTLPQSLDGAHRDGHPKTVPSTNGKVV